MPFRDLSYVLLTDVDLGLWFEVHLHIWHHLVGHIGALVIRDPLAHFIDDFMEDLTWYISHV